MCFAVNTLAPWQLTQLLLPLLDRSARVVNVSSAAQAPVDLRALRGQQPLKDMEAYAQSNLALTQWSLQLTRTLGDEGPAIIAVNPGSLLASKMVNEGFGVAGSDLGIGAGILVRAELSDENPSLGAVIRQRQGPLRLAPPRCPEPGDNGGHSHGHRGGSGGAGPLRVGGYWGVHPFIGLAARCSQVPYSGHPFCLRMTSNLSAPIWPDAIS